MVHSVVFVVVLFALNHLVSSETTISENYNSTATTEMSTEALTTSTDDTRMSTTITTTTTPPITSTQSSTTTTTSLLPTVPSSTTITSTQILVTQSPLSTPLLPSSAMLTQLSSKITSVITSESSSVTITSESPPTTAGLTSPPSSTVTHRYPVFMSQNGHDCSHFEYVFDSNTKLCTHKCETIHCQNKGVCVLIVQTNGEVTAGCRCNTNGDTVYSGNRCEKSEISRQKERGITLGILIPITAISLLFLVCMYVKVKRYGSAESRFRNNYNVNAGNL